MKTPQTKLIVLSLLMLVSGCVILDTSIPAVNAGDYTLIASACSAVPGRGMDVCQVTSGTPISSAWTMVLPDSWDVQGGEIDVYYRDIHKTYAVNQKTVQIVWREFFGVDTWSEALDGEAMALVSVRWKDNSGIVQTTHFRGLAKIIVTSPGYSRMAIDSGYAAWTTECKVQYSTSGRSALKCQ